MSAAGVMVRFNSPDEFLDELAKSQTNLVRVTREFRGTKLHPLRALFVVATYLDSARTVQPTLVRLDAYCGETIETGDEADKRSSALVSRLLKSVTERAVETGAGIFEYQAS